MSIERPRGRENFIEPYPDAEKQIALEEQINALKQQIKESTQHKERRKLRLELIGLMKSHPDYLKREIKASMIGGADISGFSDVEKQVIDITAEALVESGISLYTGGYSGVMEESSKVFFKKRLDKEIGGGHKIGVLPKLWAINFKKGIIPDRVPSKWALQKPQESREAREKILAKEMDIVIAMKGKAGTAAELYKALIEDWPERDKRRFIVAFGVEHALNLIHGLSRTYYKQRKEDVYYLDPDDLKEKPPEELKGDLGKMFEIFYKEIYFPDKVSDEEKHSLGKYKFIDRLKNEPELKEKILQAYEEQLDSLVESPAKKTEI